MCQEIWRQNAYNTFWHLIHNIHTRFHIPHWIFSHNPHWFFIFYPVKAKQSQGQIFKSSSCLSSQQRNCNLWLLGSFKTIKTFVQFHLQWLCALLCLLQTDLIQTLTKSSTLHSHALFLGRGHFFRKIGQRQSMSIILYLTLPICHLRGEVVSFFNVPSKTTVTSTYVFSN